MKPNEGYMILDNGAKIPIFLGHCYGTYDYSMTIQFERYYSECGSCGHGINWGRGNNLESETFKVRRKYGISFETSLDNMVFVIKTLVLPEDTQRLTILHEVEVIDPITLPPKVKVLTFSRKFTITNLEDFAHKDVNFQISNR